MLKPLAIVGLALALISGSARGDWPEKPVKVVVPFAAGGGTDVVARGATEHLSRVFGQPFVIESRTGGSGAIGAEVVARATPDGYTLLITTTPPLAIVPHMRKLNYDPFKDFAPIGRIAESTPLFAVHPSVPATNFAEFVALAKAKPGTIHYGSAGIASITHLRGVLLAQQAGIDIVHVPYKGGAETLVDVVAGNIECMFDGSVMPYVRAGKLKVIASMDTVRHPEFPDLPTLRESGLPDYEVANWVGVLAPAGLPPKILIALSRELNVVGHDKELNAKIIPIGQRLVGDTPEGMSAALKRQWDLYAEIFKKIDFKAE